MNSSEAMTTRVPSTDLPPAHYEGEGWTLREIEQQPALWREVERRLTAARGAVGDFLAPLLARNDLRIVLTGAGTSAFAGGVLAPVLARRLGRRVEAMPSTDIVSNPRECFAEDVPTLLVSFARSGDSPESVATTELAAQVLTECFHLVVTCNPEGRLARNHSGTESSLVLLMPEAANDRAFAMTSSFTCMSLATRLALVSDTGTDVQGGLVERLARSAESVLATTPALTRALADGGFERIVYLGSGPLAALARESALKLLELTAGGVVTYFDSPLGFRHGPKSVLDDTTLALVYVSNDPYTRAYDLDIVAELRAALPPGHVIAVTAKHDDVVADDPAGTWVLDGLEDVDDAALALPYVVCAQLLGLHLSLALGMTPDNPFPSGEVNRVVRGVTIHPLVDPTS